MSVIVILILVSLGLAGSFLACFIWAVRSGQFEDTVTPSLRILAEDAVAKEAPDLTGKIPPDFSRFSKSQPPDSRNQQ